jgi:hypothetical protein
MWEMPFDEEASAQSFREALTQWRAGHQEENKEEEVHAKKPGMDTAHSIIEHDRSVFISFHS